MDELRPKMKTMNSSAQQITLDCISSQQSHGSPYHVHPYPSPVRLQHAFQAQNSSPKMFYPKGLKPHIDPRTYGTPQPSPILGRALCLTPKGSPVPGRVSHLNEKFQDSLTLNSDTDALVAKISAMFPTVSETHIKILLKKYYNREAVVISALQVEKHPITTPGPLTMSPSAARFAKGAAGVYSALQLAKGMSGSMHGSSHFTQFSGSPQGSPSLLRPTSGASSYYGTKSIDGIPPRQQSPKMKLKYLKSVFPKAEETLILDILANKDNNVQRAGEELISLGFVKRFVHPKKDSPKPPPPPKKVVSIMKTMEEKNELRQKLQKKYPKIAERVISIALESVDFNEERAEQILSSVVDEEPPKKPVELKEVKRVAVVEPKKGATLASPRAPSPPPAVRRLKPWTATLNNGNCRPILKTSNTSDAVYKSQYNAPKKGPNPVLRQGPQDGLLLEDYLPWTGPNPDLRSGQFVRPDGPEQRKSSHTSLARGPSGRASGPAGLAKGPMYQKINTKCAKMSCAYVSDVACDISTATHELPLF